LEPGLYGHTATSAFLMAQPQILQAALAVAEDEGKVWSLAGARGLSLLAAIALGG